MKHLRLMPLAVVMGLAFAACDDEQGIGEDWNPEDDGVEIVDFEGDYWSSLIDNPQYYGELLYGEDARNYSWTDANTHLHGGMTNAWGGLYGFSEGGVAISNYVDANYAEERSYDIQLSVPVTNGSDNFAVVYCGAGIDFSDNVAREIKSMDLCLTTYVLSVIKNGNAFARPLTDEGDFFNLIVTGYNGEEVVGSKTIYLVKDGSFLTGWMTADLSSLGKVTRLDFSMESSDSSDYGPNTPAYFAIDNVRVVK